MTEPSRPSHHLASLQEEPCSWAVQCRPELRFASTSENYYKHHRGKKTRINYIWTKHVVNLHLYAVLKAVLCTFQNHQHGDGAAPQKTDT